MTPSTAVKMVITWLEAQEMMPSMVKMVMTNSKAGMAMIISRVEQVMTSSTVMKITITFMGSLEMITSLADLAMMLSMEKMVTTNSKVGMAMIISRVMWGMTSSTVMKIMIPSLAA